MIDIVIALGTGGQRHDDIELRFALRSIEKNLLNYGNIYLIGEKPAWVTSQINHVPFEDVKKRKQYSIRRKILRACKHPHISEQFIFWNDDHYLLKPIRQIPIWHNGQLKKEIARSEGNYQKNVKLTYDFLREKGIEEPIYYDVHTPIIYSKEAFKNIMEDIEDEKVIKSVYGNLVMGGEGVVIEDLKINNLQSEEQVRELIKDKILFSTGPQGIRPPLIKVLKELFPDKSKYEK